MSEIQRARPRIGGGDKKFEPILYLDGVSVSFDGYKALNGLSFYVDPGELRAIIGPNGAGKTSLFNCVSGSYRPQQGRILLNGAEITFVRACEWFGHRLALTQQ